ncbi:MAG: carbohydrate ABC transporter permease [Caldilineaceae bacterium SB0662_bin_9]|uniref:Carbohydrate ABC transporter permease n=1 Tax=Caldilineaceae bacterium SB0662_bin_9 TaxID=2605258 RepID=A0A6B1DUN4_9CHLR|nr:carbohydrate ABC transporter permease [Caldilineaceae bacterium]MXZ25182.1 carbohydrate ABC transporter permease [Caldilineaceae bacterium SB0665_bin_21]MYA03719.1 carbohydrate ABC transporter permease [Caldilineaceae bacterium SB0664_bin_22]MYC62151.1 carbohydrate ABC transporter permease [Caldilineaceae bacterium SB0661_bin_34]MYD90515.1 carbohydrate ABC transporter permease [Caldilineaceae bacterium SB0662_bin_9]
MVARLKLVMGAQGRLTVGRVLLWIIGLWLAYMWILPFVWMVSTSFKLPGEVMTQTIEWIPRTWTLDNYRVVFQKPIVRWLWNSMVVTTSITLASIMLGAAAGYALARMNFPGRNVFFMMLLLSLMIPTEMTIVPRFIAFLRLRATDSYAALILPPIAEVFSVYLFRQFFLSLPRELEEAAAMDGASRFRIFRVIALPLARATTIAAAVLLFTTNWNAFLWPLLITFSEEMKTLPIGMAAFAPVTMNRTQIESYAPGMAAMTILGVPSLIVFLFLQRYFMEGVISTGIKG